MPGPTALLAFVAGALTPSPSYGELVDRFRGNSSRFAHAMPTQVAYSDASAVRRATVGVQQSLSPLAGSEDWGDSGADQWLAGARSEGADLPELVPATGRSRLGGFGNIVSMFVPHLPGDLIEGRGTGYNTDAYPKGWIIVSQAGPPAWGGSAGLAASRPNVQRATLLEPTDKTPKPRSVVDAYNGANPGRQRLTDLFGD